MELGEVEHLFDLFMSPGSGTERVHFYAAPYTPSARTAAGGGVVEEGEDIEVVELALSDALQMCRDGRICDGKTVVLLQWAAQRHHEGAGQRRRPARSGSSGVARRW